MVLTPMMECGQIWAAGLCFAISSGPAMAFACSVVPEVGLVSPQDGRQTPARTQVIVGSLLAGARIEAVLSGPDGSRPLTTTPLGAYEVAIDVPVGGGPMVEAFFVDQPNSGRLILELNRSDLDDLQPPSAPTGFAIRGGPTRNSCFTPGTEFIATFQRGADPQGVAAHILYETFGRRVVPIGARQDSSAEPTELRLMVLYEPGVTVNLDGRCFFVVAVDFAGNESPPSNVSCFGDGLDGGVVDAALTDIGGTIDAGDATDATTPIPGDSGAPTGPTGDDLESAEKTCGCTSTANGRPTAAVVWLLLAAISLGVMRRDSWRRYRSSRAEGYPAR